MSSSIDANLGRSEMIASRQKEMMKRVRNMPVESDYELTLTDMVETPRNIHEITVEEDEEVKDRKLTHINMTVDKEEDKIGKISTSTRARKESKSPSLLCFSCFKSNKLP